MTLLFSWPSLMRWLSFASIPNFVVLGCLEVVEKFRVGGVVVVGWWGHFHSKNRVTPTLSWVGLG